MNCPIFESGRRHFMARKAFVKQRLAEPAGDERGDPDVRVQEDPHEASWNTSSSVSQPIASALGTSSRRMVSRRARISKLRSASRTISLRVLPMRFASRDSSLSALSSSLIVNVTITVTP